MAESAIAADRLLREGCDEGVGVVARQEVGDIDEGSGWGAGISLMAVVVQPSRAGTMHLMSGSSRRCDNGLGESCLWGMQIKVSIIGVWVAFQGIDVLQSTLWQAQHPYKPPLGMCHILIAQLKAHCKAPTLGQDARSFPSHTKYA